jgi:hypothetical protein
MQTLPINQRLAYQYEGFLNAKDIRAKQTSPDFLPFLTTSEAIPNTTTLNNWQQTIPPKLALGKRVEHFMSYYLGNHSPYKILAQNIQIFNKKITIGELDFLIQHSDTQQIIHLEQVYKFYLYVPNSTLSLNDPWIGPNYKDSFQQKMNKLNQKQFPLLYQENTKKALEHLNLNFSKTQQQLSFKAALFLPYNKLTNTFKAINNSCIEGTWMRLEDFEKNDLFQEAQFYLPEKQDWGVPPKHHSTWFSYASILPKIQASLAQKRAPLCWLKTPTKEYQKLFVVWW